MGRNIASGLVAFIGVGLLMAACGSSKKTSGGSQGEGGEGGSGASACEASTKRCDGNTIKRCNASGTNETIERTCAAGLFCREDGDDAVCDTAACSPNQPVCDGAVATSCKADGSGPKPGGTDCTAAKQSCTDGKCQAFTCESGQKVCNNGGVYLCGMDGKTASLVTVCASTDVCDADVAACRPKLCEPSKATCTGTVAKTCNASGSGFLAGSVDCAADGKMCVAGSCGTKVCEPVQRLCKDGDIYQCDLDGMGATLSQSCNHVSEHCEESSGGFAFCYQNECEPGDKVCDGNVAKVCNDEHYLPQEGTICGSDEWCEDGECVLGTCTPDTAFCKGSDVYYCQFGQPPSLYIECPDETACRDIFPTGNPQVTNPSCVPFGCTPGMSACLLNKLGTCGTDGESLSAVATDCTATSDICTPEGTCAKTATDTLGVDESVGSLSAGVFFGAVIEARSARKVTELQMWLVFASSRQIRWVIYEQSGSSFVPKVDKLVTVANSTGMVSSGVGSFSFQMQAGKRYALGVVPSADIVDAYDTAPFATNPSFGTLIGRAIANYPGNFNPYESVGTDIIDYMKVVTAP